MRGWIYKISYLNLEWRLIWSYESAEVDVSCLNLATLNHPTQAKWPSIKITTSISKLLFDIIMIVPANADQTTWFSISKTLISTYLITCIFMTNMIMYSTTPSCCLLMSRIVYSESKTLFVFFSFFCFNFLLGFDPFYKYLRNYKLCSVSGLQ